MGARSPNPYRPGFNQAPSVLAGREQLLGDAHEAIETAALDYRTPRPLILVGPRGVGKTVTLAEIASRVAEARAWPAVHVEAAAGVDLVAVLATRLDGARQLLEGRAPRTGKPGNTRITAAKVSAGAFGLGGEVSLRRSVARPPGLAVALEAVMGLAIDRDSGVLVTLDELHTAEPAQIGQIAAVLQEAVPFGWPLVVCAAALPSIRVAQGSRRLPTYLERAEWHELGSLPDDDARRALVEPAREAGRPMDEDAAELLIAVAGGYPYAVQVAGHFTWRASHGSDRITAAHATVALPRIRDDLAHLFASRWADASGKQREYLAAMAHLAASGPVRSGAVAARLGATTPQVSYLRERLIRKGTIYPGPDSSLHFITPGMAEWIREHE